MFGRLEMRILHLIIPPFRIFDLVLEDPMLHHWLNWMVWKEVTSRRLSYQSTRKCWSIQLLHIIHELEWSTSDPNQQTPHFDINLNPIFSWFWSKGMWEKNRWCHSKHHRMHLHIILDLQYVLWYFVPQEHITPSQILWHRKERHPKQRKQRIVPRFSASSNSVTDKACIPLDLINTYYSTTSSSSRSEMRHFVCTLRLDSDQSTTVLVRHPDSTRSTWCTTVLIREGGNNFIG